MKGKRLVAWSVVIVATVLVARFVISWSAAQRVRAILAPYVAEPTDLDISVDLVGGSFEMNGVELRVPAGMYPGAPLLRARVDSISVSGISVFRLLFTSTFAMDVVRVRAGDILVVVEPRDTLATPTEHTEAKKRYTILVNRFDLRFTELACRTLGADTATYALDSLLLAGSGFHLDLHGADPFPHFANSAITVSGFQMARASGYSLRVARATSRDNGAALLATQVAYAPTVGVQAFTAGLDLERDVFDLRFDTVALTGFDLERWYATRLLRSRTLRIANGEVTVSRDKTLRDGPQPFRPLVGTLVRTLPPGSGADTVVLANWNATYRERSDRDRGYATFPFTALNAVATHVGNSRSQPTVVQGNCTVFGNSPATITLTTDLQDSTDRFVVDGRLGYLHFTALNVASSPLLDVRATAGHLRSLAFHMEGNDRRAHGTVAMRYDGIKLTGGRLEKDLITSKILSAAINALVRNDSKGADGTDRVGSFAIERRRDRGMLHYLWSGLREGSKDMLLPKALTK